MQAVTVRFPDEVYEGLRHFAHNERQSMNSVTVAAVEYWVEQQTYQEKS